MKMLLYERKACKSTELKQPALSHFGGQADESHQILYGEMLPVL